MNMLGAGVSGIWLAILGDWWALGAGILGFFFSTGMLGFALIPGALFLAPAAHFAEKGKILGTIVFGGLSLIYTYGLITVWCCGVLFLFVSDATASTLIPRLIWSYMVATGPWVYMAAQEDEGGAGDASTMAVFLAQLAYVVVILLVLFGPTTAVSAIKVFVAFMAVGVIFQLSAVMMVHRQQTRFLIAGAMVAACVLLLVAGPSILGLNSAQSRAERPLKGGDDQLPRAVTELRQSISLLNSGFSLLAELETSSDRQGDIAAARELWQRSQTVAERIDCVELNELKPGMGDVVKEHYLEALRYYNLALSGDGDERDAARGDAAMVGFNAWMDRNEMALE